MNAKIQKILLKHAKAQQQAPTFEFQQIPCPLPIPPTMPSLRTRQGFTFYTFDGRSLFISGAPKPLISVPDETRDAYVLCSGSSRFLFLLSTRNKLEVCRLGEFDFSDRSVLTRNVVCMAATATSLFYVFKKSSTFYVNVAYFDGEKWIGKRAMNEIVGECASLFCSDTAMYLVVDGVTYDEHGTVIFRNASFVHQFNQSLVICQRSDSMESSSLGLTSSAPANYPPGNNSFNVSHSAPPSTVSADGETCGEVNSILSEMSCATAPVPSVPLHSSSTSLITFDLLLFERNLPAGSLEQRCSMKISAEAGSTIVKADKDILAIATGSSTIVFVQIESSGLRTAYVFESPSARILNFDVSRKEDSVDVTLLVDKAETSSTARATTTDHATYNFQQLRESIGGNALSVEGSEAVKNSSSGTVELRAEDKLEKNRGQGDARELSFVGERAGTDNDKVSKAEHGKESNLSNQNDQIGLREPTRAAKHLPMSEYKTERGSQSFLSDTPATFQTPLNIRWANSEEGSGSASLSINDSNQSESPESPAAPSGESDVMSRTETRTVPRTSASKASNSTLSGTRLAVSKTYQNTSSTPSKALNEPSKRGRDDTDIETQPSTALPSVSERATTGAAVVKNQPKTGLEAKDLNLSEEDVAVTAERVAELVEKAAREHAEKLSGSNTSQNTSSHSTADDGTVAAHVSRKEKKNLLLEEVKERICALNGSTANGNDVSAAAVEPSVVSKHIISSAMQAKMRSAGLKKPASQQQEDEVQSALRGALQSVLAKNEVFIKDLIAKVLVPPIEAAMNEMRLQMLAEVRKITSGIKTGSSLEDEKMLTFKRCISIGNHSDAIRCILAKSVKDDEVESYLVHLTSDVLENVDAGLLAELAVRLCALVRRAQSEISQRTLLDVLSCLEVEDLSAEKIQALNVALRYVRDCEKVCEHCPGLVVVAELMLKQVRRRTKAKLRI